MEFVTRAGRVLSPLEVDQIVQEHEESALNESEHDQLLRLKSEFSEMKAGEGRKRAKKALKLIDKVLWRWVTARKFRAFYAFRENVGASAAAEKLQALQAKLSVGSGSNKDDSTSMG